MATTARVYIVMELVIGGGPLLDKIVRHFYFYLCNIGIRINISIASLQPNIFRTSHAYRDEHRECQKPKQDTIFISLYVLWITVTVEVLSIET